MKKTAALACILCLILCGCRWMDSSYHSVTPHHAPQVSPPSQTRTVSNEQELCTALTELIARGDASGIFALSGSLNESALQRMMPSVIRYVTQQTPIGAYAAEDLSWEVGASAGTAAIAVRITYRHTQAELQQIQHISNTEQAKAQVNQAVEQCSTEIVLWIDQYEDLDFTQVVQDYALLHPETVMELPKVTVSLYPDSGSSRVAELQFTYQTSRDALKTMQRYVQQVFSAAPLYVIGDAEDIVKYSQLDSFLMERYHYHLETSITPAYSLLRHGVGDSKAFACVYAAMCRQAGLECLIVSGTRAGEPHFWNMIQLDGVYYHIDLLSGSEQLEPRTDAQMQGYVWDYSAYPESKPQEK